MFASALWALDMLFESVRVGADGVNVHTHGYGLQSIYGHLSQIQVKPGDMVKKGQTMGRSGETGPVVP